MNVSAHNSPPSNKVPWKHVMTIVGAIAIPVLFLVDTMIATKLGYSMGRATYMLFVFMLTMTTSLVLANLFPPVRVWFERYGSRLLLLTVATTVALLSAEGVLRVTRQRPSFHLRTAGLQAVFHPKDDYVPGTSPVAEFHVNSLGVRGTEPPPRDEAYRILCIGGSTTECLYLDNNQTWPAVLMERLNQSDATPNVWVGNAGMAGYDSAHHLRLIRNREFIAQFDCLVLLVGFNDLARHLRGAAPGHDRPYPLWRKTQCAALAYDLLLGGVHHDNEGEIYYSQRVKRRAGKKLDEVPDLTEGIRSYQETLRSIIEACRESEIRCVFVTQPVLWDANLDDTAKRLLWLGDLEGGEFLEPGPLRESIQLFNDKLREISRSTETELVEVESLNGKEKFFCDDCHFTIAGAEEMGRLIADHFRLSQDSFKTARNRGSRQVFSN